METQNNQVLTVLETKVSNAVRTNLRALTKSVGIKYPADYNPENAMAGALYALQNVSDKNGNNMMEEATTNVKTFNSIINAINSMVIQGLDAGKNQAYFIAYGDEVMLQRSYFGTVTMLKRLPEIKDIVAYDYYQDNQPEFAFDMETMTLSKMKSWNPNHKSQDLAGAFAVIYKDDGTFEITNMTRDQIWQSWSQSQNYGKTVWLNTPEEIAAAKKSGHKVIEGTSNGKKWAKYKTDEPNDVQSKFPGEMAKRTVINRAAKLYVNSSNAPTEVITAYNETTENGYKELKEAEPVVDKPRDYAAELQETKSIQELNIVWNHTVPDDDKMDLLLVYQAKKDELEAEHAIPTDD